ncbi:hypothetical protein HBH61_226750 [Parastagonospora nodorum]|nr:hypothetical protein HBH61_226750 [Parastagonospora nodorum]
MYLDQLHKATVSIPHFTQVSSKMLLLLTITLLISLIYASPLDTLANTTLHGPPAIETYSLNTLIAETPVISLSADSQRAKGQ